MGWFNHSFIASTLLSRATGRPQVTAVMSNAVIPESGGSQLGPTEEPVAYLCFGTVEQTTTKSKGMARMFFFPFLVLCSPSGSVKKDSKQDKNPMEYLLNGWRTMRKVAPSCTSETVDGLVAYILYSGSCWGSYPSSSATATLLVAEIAKSISWLARSLQLSNILSSSASHITLRAEPQSALTTTPFFGLQSCLLKNHPDVTLSQKVGLEP